MRLTQCEQELMRRMAAMPFLDRLEMAAVSGWSKGAVYRAVRNLEEGGLAAPIPHATDLTPLSARYHLTAAGLRRLAQWEGLSLDELLELYPVSSRWRRTLIERLDALAVIYRLAAAVSNIAYPIRLRWYRAAPMDAVLLLPGRRTVAVVRQGLTSDRTAFSKRLWRLWEGPVPGAVLLLMPDEVRLRHARRLLTRARAPALLALERDAAQANEGDPVWRLPSISAAIDLRSALDRAGVGGPLSAEPALSRASIPWDIPGDPPGSDLPEYMLPALLKSAEKRALDLLSDWPLISRKDLASLLAVSESRASQLVSALAGFGLVTRVAAAGRRLALTDKALALLARRDRASFSIARRRWSVAPLDPEAPLDWRNVSGARSRQLLRNPHHTDAVHGFVAALARQSRSLGWEIVQLDPPRKASRYFRYDDALRSIHPDAFGVLRKGRTTWPFFLEWERRAVRPTTMAARIAPYLRYYSSHRPTDDHGARPAVLVVFDDDLAATHFLRVAREEMRRTGVNVPLRVSHRGALTSRSGWASGRQVNRWRDRRDGCLAWEPCSPRPHFWRTPEGSGHPSAPQVAQHR